MVVEHGYSYCVNRSCVRCVKGGVIMDRRGGGELLLSSDYVTLSEKRKCHPG